ncbi:Z1 domain-containing protein [Flavobacterium sp. K77]|uniref:Z1 domain-containing protein n=1 Tax=Flavobacterium sp. K77 TaxID=2910676 RepID=UPI001F396D21|nr:Z1 domain-containing protein [Flavobacterium sp. K77]MCF6140981.1 Z1 domain-containing protein [Flavobacterium sp. K77]
MADTIKIINENKSEFNIIQGSRTLDLINRLTKLDSQEKETLLHESESILKNCINPVETIGSTTGIAIGYVQSGKTMSFTTLTALAIDNGFRIIIYFAGIKNNLLEQTTNRLKKDLLTDSDNSRFYKVYQNPTIKNNVHLKIKGALLLNQKPAILITILKRFDSIDSLTKVFETFEVKEALGNNGVLIIDDEADQASLNTYGRKNSKSEDWEEDEFSSTYSSILNLRAALTNHSYIQYTATPQGPLLINIMDLLSPKFHKVLTPGKSYTGGKTFFEDNTDLIISIPENEVYHHKKNQLSECPQSLINALQVFICGVAITVNIKGKENFLSMLIHADSLKDVSRQFHDWVKMLKDSWEDRLQLPDGDPSKSELIEQFKENYSEAVRRIQNPPEFKEVMVEVLQVILDTNIELVIAGSKEIDWSNATAHILVGADMLNRGYTVEGLMVSYMPRYSIGKSNADTIQQRCRFFGYKRNFLDSCRVYLPNESIMEYREYVEHEEIFRANLKEHSLEEYEQLLILSGNVNPTRNNILSVDLIKHKLSGWRQLNALQHIDENNVFVEKFIANNTFTNFEDFVTPDRRHRYIKIDINAAIEFLKNFKIANMPDALRKSSTIQYLRFLADKKEVNHVYIFQMAYSVEEGRRRSLDTEEGKLKISNIFSGRALSGTDKYPGDKGVSFEDSICIQIHRIRLKHPSMQWDNKLVHTLGIYYPEDFAHSFVGINK